MLQKMYFIFSHFPHFLLLQKVNFVPGKIVKSFLLIIWNESHDRKVAKENFFKIFIMIFFIIFDTLRKITKMLGKYKIQSDLLQYTT